MTTSEERGSESYVEGHRLCAHIYTQLVRRIERSACVLRSWNSIV